MNEDKIIRLANCLYNAVESFACREEFTKGEVSAAFGIALGSCIEEATKVSLKAELPREPVPDEEEEAEEEGEEFRFLSVQERLFAFNELAPKYGDEDTRLMCEGKLEVPKWLQKVIVERRG